MNKTEAKIALVTGGTRSGKSSYALRVAESLPGKKLFVATGTPLDEEMEHRIERHKKERNSELWTTLEEQTELVNRLNESSCDVLVVDCLTLWLSNLLQKDGDFNEERLLHHSRKLIGCIKGKNVNAFFVTNEVGMGVHPSTELGRNFRDFQGMMNQEIAREVDEVVLMVCGLPMKLKTKL